MLSSHYPYELAHHPLGGIGIRSDHMERSRPQAIESHYLRERLGDYHRESVPGKVSDWLNVLNEVSRSKALVGNIEERYQLLPLQNLENAVPV